MEQTDLHAHRTVARLPLADHMNRFIAGDRAPGSPEGAEMLACTHPAFDGPMVLFQDIIEVLHRAMPARLNVSSDRRIEMIGRAHFEHRLPVVALARWRKRARGPGNE